MPTYTVKISALTDMIARIEVEADTPERAVDLALEQVEGADFDTPEDGAEPMQNTWEAFAVEDDDGEEVLTLPQKSYSDIAAAVQAEPTGARMEDGTIVTPWDERLRAAGGMPIYDAPPAAPSFYAVHVYGDVEPNLHGPYQTEDERDQAARRLRKENDPMDGIYWLNAGSNMAMGAYSGGFFEVGGA
jgi:hypothetical protein